MQLPFTVEQFLQVFEQYNTAIWPMQVVVYLLALTAIFGVFKRSRFAATIVTMILAFVWLWNGIVYHMLFFTRINQAAWLFGALFILQGLLLLHAGILRRRLTFSFRFEPYAVTGVVFILFAMIIYPVLGNLLGHTYPRSPCFGVAPCPTVVFTFGLLLLADRKVPGWLLLIPVLWSLVGFSAAINLGIREDFGLLVAGLVGTFLILLRNRQVTRRLE